MPKFAAVSLAMIRNGCIFKFASLAQLARARDL